MLQTVTDRGDECGHQARVCVLLLWHLDQGEAEDFCCGISHKGICPLLMAEYLRAAVSAEPEGREHRLPILQECLAATLCQQPSRDPYALACA